MEITKQQAMTAIALLTGRVSFVNEVNKYAASRNTKKLKSTVEDVEEYTQERRLHYCFKDGDQCPVKDDKGNMKFKPEEEKKFNADIKKCLAEKIEIEPYQFRNNPEMQSQKYIFMNSDLEFLLVPELLAEPGEPSNKE